MGSTEEHQEPDPLQPVKDQLPPELEIDILQWNDEEMTTALALTYAQAAFWRGVEAGIERPKELVDLAAAAGYDITKGKLVS